jgi:hypothetical protein
LKGEEIATQVSGKKRILPAETEAGSAGDATMLGFRVQTYTR